MTRAPGTRRAMPSLLVLSGWLAGSGACAPPAAPTDAGPFDAPAPVDAPRALDAPLAPDAPDAPPICAPTARPTGTSTVTGSLGATSSPITAADLCAAFAAAVCTPVCGCPVPEGCAEQALEQCEYPNGPLNAATRAAIDAGAVTYDPVAAGRVIAAITEAAADCAHQPRVNLTDLLAATGALYSSTPVGAPCFPDQATTCARGSRCSYDFDFTFVCRRPPAASGDACTELGLCFLGTGAVADLRCAGASCDLGAPPGTACAGSPRCVTGTCQDGYCVCEAAVGEACTLDAECATEHCRDGLCSAAARPRLGDACSDTARCAEGECSAGVCAPLECSGRLWYF